MRSLTLVAVTAMAACGASATPETAEDDIRGGRAEAGHPEVGALRARDALVCTGTLVTRTHVLTAAHCFDDASASEVVFGDRSYAIASRAIHPTYRRAMGGLPLSGIDVAVAQLAEPVVAIAPANLSELGELAGREDLFVRSIGFGRDDDLETGTKRSALEWVTRIDEQTFTTMGISGSTDHGDSGGPVYLGASVVGTTSHGFHPSVSMNIGAARSWLDGKTRGEITWTRAEVTLDPDAPHEVCERAAANLCVSASDDVTSKREHYVGACVESYRACGQPPAFAVCMIGELTCNGRVRCSMLPEALCLSNAPPKTWAAESREAACAEYADARVACADAPSREKLLADCSRRFDDCYGRVPEAVRCTIRDGDACDVTCLERGRCL